MGGWRGLALPVGVPRDRFETLHSAVRAVILGDDYLQAMRAAGFDTTSAEPEEFRAVLERLDAQFGAILTGESFRTVRRTRFGPMTFPAILAVLLAITFTALSLTGGFKTWEGLQAATPAGLRRVGLALGAVILYLLLAETLGYVLTASLSLLLLLRGLQVRWPVAIGVTALLVPLSYQVFAVAMRVPLPWGLLGW
jgi:putative tricarboxylic transport membrane protein